MLGNSFSRLDIAAAAIVSPALAIISVVSFSHACNTAARQIGSLPSK
jgi:hypothetical protein